MNKIIQVFEHQNLLYDDNGPFQKAHWKALARWQDAQENRSCFFRMLGRGVKFAQYVGAIHVNGLTIEILPKVDKPDRERAENKLADIHADTVQNRWQRVLLKMLRECRWMTVHVNDNAHLQLRHNSILDAYLKLFLDACEHLLHEGLVKKYRKRAANSTSLKGRLLFEKQIRHNLIHKQKFYVDYNVYDKNNTYNRLLFKAIKLVMQLSRGRTMADIAGRLILDWPEVADIQISEKQFHELAFDRKTERYREAIEIARMLLLNYRPDISGGNNNVLAILFDMNQLWEEFVYHRLQKHIARDSDWRLSNREYTVFWRGTHTRNIYPDLVLRHKSSDKVIVIDTKWKMPEAKGPTNDDLKQMFVYNIYWQCTHSFLLYPSAVHHKGDYGKLENIESHSCSVVSIQVVRDGCLNTTLGQEIFSLICS